MKNVVLIGMPGAGKSTVGVLLAKVLKRPFIDTDLIIQAQTDCYLSEIIAEAGMDAFLDLEARIVCALAAEGAVIATGGSVVYRPHTMAHLRARGTTVFLSLPYEVIERRVTNTGERGVVIAPGQSLYDLFLERQPLYRRYADLTIEAAGLAPDAVAARVAEALRALA